MKKISFFLGTMGIFFSAPLYAGLDEIIGVEWQTESSRLRKVENHVTPKKNLFEYYRDMSANASQNAQDEGKATEHFQAFREDWIRKLDKLNKAETKALELLEKSKASHSVGEKVNEGKEKESSATASVKEAISSEGNQCVGEFYRRVFIKDEQGAYEYAINKFHKYQTKLEFVEDNKAYFRSQQSSSYALSLVSIVLQDTYETLQTCTEHAEKARNSIKENQSTDNGIQMAKSSLSSLIEKKEEYEKNTYIPKSLQTAKFEKQCEEAYEYPFFFIYGKNADIAHWLANHCYKWGERVAKLSSKRRSSTDGLLPSVMEKEHLKRKVGH